MDARDKCGHDGLKGRRIVTFSLITEQFLNGVQLGVMLFLMSAGLTLVFGIMNFINLTHGSLYMIGAFAGAATQAATGSFLLAMLAAPLAAAIAGLALESALLKRFYGRDHLDQVLVTFGSILALNEATRMVFGLTPLRMNLPPALSGHVNILGVPYPAFRLAILVVGLVVAVSLYFIIMRTRIGMWVRAGASNRPIASAMGVNVPLVFAALLVGVVDTLGRVLLTPALGSMAIFVMMAAILAIRPKGLFPAHG